MAQQAGVRILVGDDYSGVFRTLLEDDPLDHQVGNYGREFAFYAEIDGLSPADVLSWGTRNAGQLLVDPPAKVGVVEAGALADLIVVDGDPLADLSLLARPERGAEGRHPRRRVRDRPAAAAGRPRRDSRDGPPRSSSSPAPHPASAGPRPRPSCAAAGAPRSPT